MTKKNGLNIYYFIYIFKQKNNPLILNLYILIKKAKTINI